MDPVGPGYLPLEGTVVDLLFDTPYAIRRPDRPPYKPLPSRDELNALLRSGKDDAGMSGGTRWEPFELGTEEYAEVMEALQQDPRYEKPGAIDPHFDEPGASL